MKKVLNSFKKFQDLIKELKKTEKGKSILFFSFWGLFFLVVAIMARVLPRGQVYTVDDYIKNDAFSFASIEKNNYSFNMTVERDGKLIDVSLTTSSIILDSVFSKVIEEDNKKIGYMYISIFALNTYEQFNKQLLELEKQNIDSLIIDVRDNSGGHLSSVTDILNLFLNKNQVLYQVKSKDKIKKVYGTTDNDRKYNIVVLNETQRLNKSTKVTQENK